MDALIDKFFTELKLRTNIEQPKPFLVRKPVITIARDPGSGGKPIAQMLAKKLEYDFYDEALIEVIAKSAKKRKKVIEKVDERTRTAIEDLVHNFFNPNYVSDQTYIKHLIAATLAIAHKGESVLLGRGTNFIVPRVDGLHVLITAPRKVRIERAVKYEKVSQKKAIKIIDKVSKERKDFVSQYFGKDYANPKYYDLIINTEFCDIEAVSDLIISAFRKKFPTMKEMVKTKLKQKGKLY